MKERKLPFDKKHRIIYSKTAKKIVRKRIFLHYEEKKGEEIWNKIQLAYLDYLSKWGRDLGGKKNFHNGKGGTYDCILILTYYSVCKSVTSLREIEEMEEELVLPAFKKLGFVNCDNSFYLSLMNKAFCAAKKKCDKWNDYNMNILPYKRENR